MNIIKEIKTEEVNLKDLKLKVIELETKNADNQFLLDFLEEDLTESLKALLEQKGYKIENLKIGYSLSYCQGDGFNFTGNITNKKGITFHIEQTSSHYQHSNTTSQEISYYKGTYYEDLSDSQQKKADLYLNDFKTEYHKICKEMEEDGYTLIEQAQDDNILKIGFNEFCEKNGFEESDLWNFEYTTAELKAKKDKWVKVCSKNDTHILGLWIKPCKVKIVKSLRAIAEIKEEETRTFI